MPKLNLNNNKLTDFPQIKLIFKVLKCKVITFLFLITCSLKNLKRKT